MTGTDGDFDLTRRRKGLERVALDLHVHTPASHDWRGADVSAAEFVKHVVSLGLDGIAVTDHATAEWVDSLRNAATAEGLDLAVFSGVELNNLAGNEGIHLIALFDTDVSTSDIDRFLTKIGVLRGAGDHLERGLATSGALEVLREIDEFGGIAVLAHCRSSKGALGAMRGDLRTGIVRHHAVLAAEAPAEDRLETYKVVPVRGRDAVRLSVRRQWGHGRAAQRPESSFQLPRASGLRHSVGGATLFHRSAALGGGETTHQDPLAAPPVSVASPPGPNRTTERG